MTKADRLINYRVTYCIPWVYTCGGLDRWRVSVIRARSTEDAKARIGRRCPRADRTTMAVEVVTP